jgi:hypothetical protein
MSALGDWLATLPTQVTQVQKSIDSINTQIADLTVKQNTLITGMNSIIFDLNNLLTTKAASGDIAYVSGYGGYGTINAYEFVVYGIMNIPVTYDTESSFTVDLSNIGLFYNDQFLGINCGVDGIKNVIVSNVASNGNATISFTVDTITSNIVKVMHVDYMYNSIGWDNDANVLQRINDFAFLYDFKTLPLGVNGTYGIDDMIVKLGQGRNILIINKNKYSGAISVFDRYD